MAEIEAVPWNGLTVASTFSGCGGSCLGYRMAGYRVVWANEFIPAAQDAYRANHRPTRLNTKDIRDIRADDIRAESGVVDIDVLDGSPPCSSFSTAGKRDKGWGKKKLYSDGVKQRTDDLFFEYARILRELKPRAFIAENVIGLVKGVAVGYFRLILRELRGCGYKVVARILDASWLGVPQARKRLIFVGVRDDIGREPTHPRPLPYQYTLGEALRLTNGMCVEKESSISHYALGREWEKLSIGEKSKKYFNLVRPKLDRPCPTILAGQSVSTASVAHPIECRKFSIFELKAISGFPLDFILPGSFVQNTERIGRAVPPPMMMRVAATVAKLLGER